MGNMGSLKTALLTIVVAYAILAFLALVGYAGERLIGQETGGCGCGCECTVENK